MDYELGTKLDKLEARMEELSQMIFVIYKVTEKSSSKFKEVVEEIKKEIKD